MMSLAVGTSNGGPDKIRIRADRASLHRGLGANLIGGGLSTRASRSARLVSCIDRKTPVR